MPPDVTSIDGASWTCMQDLPSMACGHGVCPFWLVPEQLLFVRWMRNEGAVCESRMLSSLTASESARSSSSSPSLAFLYTLSHGFGSLARPHTCPSCATGRAVLLTPAWAQAKRLPSAAGPCVLLPAGYAPRPQLRPAAATRVCPGLCAPYCRTCHTPKLMLNTNHATSPSSHPLPKRVGGRPCCIDVPKYRLCVPFPTQLAVLASLSISISSSHCVWTTVD